MKKPKIIKLIDYVFQNREQLTEARDDSNSMRYLGGDFDIEIIGRLNISHMYMSTVRDGEGNSYDVTFLPASSSTSDMINYIFTQNPDIIHMHGNHGWPQYPIYANHFSDWMTDTKLVFSPAGTSCGNESFLRNFDKVIVNHTLQVARMKCEPEKVIVRKRTADPSVFYPVAYPEGQGPNSDFDFVYVAAFVPQKRIDLMIDMVAKTKYSMAILGDFSRTAEHYAQISFQISRRGLYNQISLCDFIPQTRMSDFLSTCKIWIWPNIKPENPETTTNRSVIEALACGMPMLVGERAFRNTEFIQPGYNGYLYSDQGSFERYAKVLMEFYEVFGENSHKLYKAQFGFQENFVDFYKRFYSSLL